MYDNSFEELRYEVSNYYNNKNKEIVENWCKKCGMTEPVGYFNCLSKYEFTIYTTRPGIMIGFQGEHVNNFKEVLKEEFNHEYEVKFVEIRGSIVNY